MSVDIEKEIEKYVEKSDNIIIMDDILMSPVEDLLNLNFMFDNNISIKKVVNKYKYRFLYTDNSFVITYNSTSFILIKAFVNYNVNFNAIFWVVDFILGITSESLENAIKHFVLNISKINKAKFNGMDRFKNNESKYHINKEM